MSTPRTETIDLAANASQTCHSAGKFMAVKSCTVASFEFAFGTDGFQAGEPYCTYPSAEPFDYVRFRDSLGGGATIVVTISDEEPQDNRGNRDELEVIANSLNNIDVDTSAMVVEQTASNVLLTAANVDLAALEVLLSRPNTPTNIFVTPAQTGVGTTTISAASATKRKVFLQAPVSPVANVGDVYIRLDTPCTDANRSFCLSPGDTWAEETGCAIYASSENGTEILTGYSLAIS